MVAWLLMSLARGVLVEWGALPEATPKLSPWLSYVALGTVADCVSLGGSPANRAVVSYGNMINRMDAACWRAMATLEADSVPFNAEHGRWGRESTLARDWTTPTRRCTLCWPRATASRTGNLKCWTRTTSPAGD